MDFVAVQRRGTPHTRVGAVAIALLVLGVPLSGCGVMTSAAAVPRPGNSISAPAANGADSADWPNVAAPSQADLGTGADLSTGSSDPGATADDTNPLDLPTPPTWPTDVPLPRGATDPATPSAAAGPMPGDLGRPTSSPSSTRRPSNSPSPSRSPSSSSTPSFTPSSSRSPSSSSTPSSSRSPSSTPSSTFSSNPGPVVGVGDSVLLAASRCLRYLGVSRVDAVVGRQASEGPAAVAKLVASDNPSIIVIHLGTNGTFDANTFDKIMTAAGPDRLVIFATVSAPRSWIAGTNATIRAGALRYRNVSLLDWQDAVVANPDWVGSDRIHPSEAGCWGYASRLSGELPGT